MCSTWNGSRLVADQVFDGLEHLYAKTPVRRAEPDVLGLGDDELANVLVPTHTRPTSR